MLGLISCSSADGDESTSTTTSTSRHDENSNRNLIIDRARIEENRLEVRGETPNEEQRVSLRVLDQNGDSIYEDRRRSDDDREYRFRERPAPAPACVAEVSAEGQTVTRDIEDRPDVCDNVPPPPAAQCSDGIDNDGDGLIDFPNDPGCINVDDNDEFNAPPPPVAQCSDSIDNDGDGLIDFPNDPGCANANDNDETNGPPPAAQCSDGIDNDGDGLIDFPNDPGCANADDNDETNTPPQPIPNVSINSTSQNGFPQGPVAEQPFTTSSNFNIFAANDLGMHCGDLDTRISSILPPFNVVHAQVIQRGSTPSIMTPADGVEVIYSAASNPDDPILTGVNSAGDGPVASSLLADGSVFKTNFWDIARDAYNAFYPAGILPAFYPPNTNVLDLGLPMPNAERLYLGDGNLSAEQQEMNGRFGPYSLNDPLVYKIFAIDQPFFINFPFGYISADVNWFEAAGIPLTAYDDYGRENPWPLMRVQARAGGQVIASLDTVLPISGEANCGLCHNAPIDGGNGSATTNLTTVALSIDDTANVPMDVSLEWAADINLVRLHDEKHGTNLIVGTTMDGGSAPFKAVVCQSCHYTPALDLAQLGPRGPENDGPLVLNGVTISPSIANGADQVKHRSMSNVMHKHHASVTDTNGDLLFPTMPPAVNGDGSFRDPVAARGILMDTCYQCHPGRRTDCLRGAMANGGMLCQDCHGDMNQIGADFTDNVSPANPGAFVLGPDFYTNPNTPRVPWANEPGCGSCHTGDVRDNMVGTANTLAHPQDGIRLMQAYLSNDPKATPIVPSNKRFAENTVPSGPAAGNPMLYRVSKGHGGVFCEACHGSTHGIWPNKNPAANDNVAAVQLQGHTGTITECSTCHGTASLGNTLDGPHGMHPVGNDRNDTNGADAGPRIGFVDGGHENLVGSGNNCRVCHGNNGEGTVLSKLAKPRNLDGQTFPAGYQVGCTECHDNEL
jgi:hypothetical protein